MARSVRRIQAASILAIVLACATCVRAQEPPAEGTAPPGTPPLGSVVLLGGLPEKPPKLVLVLSGGGARGAAHVGVLKVLEELHVVPDLVVGTSMGSIVGGLYSAGWTPHEIEEYLKSVEWSQVFTDQVGRNEQSFRRKQDDTVYLVPLKLRFKGIKPYIPLGILGGQRLELLLKGLEFESTSERDFDKLPIPYRAVAADIGTGEAIVLGEGSLSTAMRASMSISGAFAPVVIDGRKLVDGGAVANLAVGIAQKLGAQKVVAVDISSPLSEAGEIGSFLSILNQMSGLLTVGNVQTDVARLAKGDVYVRPDLGDITFTDFARAEEAVAIGEAAARAKIEELKTLAASKEEWEAFLQRRAAVAPANLVVNEVRLKNDSWVADEVIRRRLEIETGTTLADAGVNDAVMKLRALDYFGTIQVDFTHEEDRGILTLDVPKAPYGRNAVQFGLGFYTDWQSGRRSDSGFEFLVRHQMLAVNRRGGEWENRLFAGTDGQFVSHFYQPLDYGMRWFADASVEVNQLNPNVWVDGDPVARYSIRSDGTRLEVGYVFENCCEVRTGPYWYREDGDVNIGIPALPSFDGKDTGVRAAFRMDTRDTTVFPRRGILAIAAYDESSGDMGSDAEVQQAYVSIDGTFTFGRNTVSLAAEAMRNNEPVSLYRRFYRLGGVFRLSGLGQDELLGDYGGLARLMYYCEISKLGFGPVAFRLFAGATVETGQAYVLDGGVPVTVDSLRAGGSLFVGAETPLGPAFVGVGFADAGRTRAYISLGQRF
jgi:NTE family protein